MNRLTERFTTLLEWPRRCAAIAMLSAAVATPGCTVLDKFSQDEPAACSCGHADCGANSVTCAANHPLAIDMSQPMTYPQQLPIVDVNAPPAPPSLPTDQWAPRETVMAQAESASCERQLQEARMDFDQKLASLELRFEKENLANSAMNDQLQTLRSDVTRLSTEVDYWENEVRRIDQTTEMHHRSDMANLRAISELIDQILPQSASSAQAPGTQRR